MSFSRSQSLDGSFPPSPVEDRSSKRLSWGSLLLRLTELKKTNQRVAADQNCRSETGSPADTSLSEFDNSIFSEPLEETLAAEITETITESLRNASHNLGCSRLLLPDCLQYSISQELLHLSSCEPCGLKGALIDLCIDRGDQDSLCNVEQIVVDASLVPTFHVTLVLRLEAGGLWPKVQKLFKGSRSPQRSGTSPRHRSIQRLSTSFRAIKRKLYSSEDLLIKECC
ncbi:DNA damage-inducible transcript 4 protein-like [Cynoglossus semilaevis]|nr:DNA damage-inducible transcript 4 protein-like [Cynoglossus semilaevis]